MVIKLCPSLFWLIKFHFFFIGTEYPKHLLRLFPGVHIDLCLMPFLLVITLTPMLNPKLHGHLHCLQNFKFWNYITLIGQFSQNLSLISTSSINFLFLHFLENQTDIIKKKTVWVNYYPHYISEFNPRLPRRLGFLRLNLSLWFRRFFFNIINSFVVFNILSDLCFGVWLCSHNKRTFRRVRNNGTQIPADWASWNPRGWCVSTRIEGRGTARDTGSKA